MLIYLLDVVNGEKYLHILVLQRLHSPAEDPPVKAAREQVDVGGEIVIGPRYTRHHPTVALAALSVGAG